jgi:hypothetical protein
VGKLLVLLEATKEFIRAIIKRKTMAINNKIL